LHITRIDEQDLMERDGETAGGKLMGRLMADFVPPPKASARPGRGAASKKPAAYVDLSDGDDDE
jgi:hypothetical protein